MDRILRQFGITHLPEEAHQRILHTLRTLQPVLGDTAVVVAPDGRILYSNDATAALLGFESSQQFATATPEEIFLCFDWLDPQGMLLSDPALPWVRMLQGDAAGRMVLGMRHRETRTELWHDVRWASVLDEQGVKQVTVITGQDITERRCAEETSRFLIEASAILSSSIDYPTTLDRVVRLGLPVVADCSAIYLPDSEGMLSLLAFAHADPEIERDGRELNIRYPSGSAGPAEVMRTGKSNLIADVPEELIRKVARDERHLELLLRVGFRSGMMVPLATRGHLIGVMTFASGGSRRRHTQQDLALAEELGRRAAVAIDNARLFHEAQEAVRARDEVMAIVSHDLRNPLSAILMHTHYLQAILPRDLLEPHEVLARVQRSGNRMERLIADLLDMARLDAGELRLVRRRWPLSSLVAEVSDAFAPLLEKKSLHLDPLPSDVVLPDLECDRERILQVLSNLLDNAIKYSPVGGAITMQIHPQDGEVQLAITDCGPGIAEADLPRLFDRFWRSPTAAQPGSGLGLYIAKRVVDHHGGRIWATSRLGRGSTFHIALPAPAARTSP